MDITKDILKYSLCYVVWHVGHAYGPFNTEKEAKTYNENNFKNQGWVNFR